MRTDLGVGIFDDSSSYKVRWGHYLNSLDGSCFVCIKVSSPGWIQITFDFQVWTYWVKDNTVLFFMRIFWEFSSEAFHTRTLESVLWQTGSQCNDLGVWFDLWVSLVVAVCPALLAPVGQTFQTSLSCVFQRCHSRSMSEFLVQCFV